MSPTVLAYTLAGVFVAVLIVWALIGKATNHDAGTGGGEPAKGDRPDKV